MILSTYFEKFVSNVQPTQERITAVSEAHNTLRSHLAGDAELVYPVADSFLSGSYARYTAIDPIKDADIILVLEEKELSGDFTEPHPRTVLKDLRDVIDDFYDEVNLETQRRSIQVQLPDDDIRMDVVPAIAPKGKDRPLYVPDYAQGRWIASHPAGHIEHARKTNSDSDGRFVRVVKALKWWRGRRFPKDRAPKSFLLEAIVAQHMAMGEDSLPEAFAATVENIREAFSAPRLGRRLPVVPDPGLPDQNDLVASCGWTLDDFLFFCDALDELAGAATAALEAATKEATIEIWQSVFGGDVYPASLTEDEERAMAKSLETAQVPAAGSAFPHRVSLSAWISRTTSAPGEFYPSNGKRLPKGWHILFRVESTTMPEPYHIKWIVRNHGVDARSHGHLYRASFGGREHWESTAYRGHHYMDCEIHKNGRVMAMKRYVVNIG